MKILIIEDNPDDAVLIEAAMEDTGWNTEAVDTGEEGIRRVLENEYDAVVLDYRLNDMTGTEVLLRIREARSTVPVVMASGADSHFIVARALAMGVGEFVSKDETTFPQKLVEAIQNVIETHKRRDPSKSTPPQTVRQRAGEVKKILATFIESSGIVSSLGIVGPDGALIHSAVKDASGAQDVTAVLANTVNMMLNTVAGHLGFGKERSLIVSFEKGALAVVPLSGGLVLYVTTTVRTDQLEKLRHEIEAAALELNQVLRPRKDA